MMYFTKEELSKMFRESLPESNWRRLIESHLTLHDLLQMCRDDRDRLQGVLAAREAELERLKPSEPKFRVHQVLILSSGNAFKVRHRRRSWAGGWEYSNRKVLPAANEWTAEAQLRALTDEEK